ncbi:MAG: hypothetical protein Q4F76_04265, partial [Lachnospiraceae bacterium]|nr:hypothetical protein [Lachnospiraceae bacterium]
MVFLNISLFCAASYHTAKKFRICVYNPLLDGNTVNVNKREKNNYLSSPFYCPVRCNGAADGVIFCFCLILSG